MEHGLRVLIANERSDRLSRFAKVIEGLGHEVVVSEIDVPDVGAATAKERPDVALVGLGESSVHALEMVSAIVRESFCPVIVLLPGHDSAFIEHAAERGVYAYIVDGSPEEVQSAIGVTLRRFADQQRLQGAFDRRNVEVAAKAELTKARQRQVLELHDGIIQELAVAQLALELDQGDRASDAIVAALQTARSVVSRAVVELQGEGLLLAQLVKDAAPH